MKSSEIGCFACGALISPSEIWEWHDDEQTGFCPKCGIDSLVGSASGYELTPEFLSTMNRYWFDGALWPQYPES
ncbi:MAG TPA: cytoplasmic protein [Clostridia bacterium]|nr:cytoplasmic protein [Clostridia bacterium]